MPPAYLIWSKEHRAWWRPNELGYTTTIGDAGRYPLEDARRIVAHANRFELEEIAIMDVKSIDAAVLAIASAPLALADFADALEAQLTAPAAPLLIIR